MFLDIIALPTEVIDIEEDKVSKSLIFNNTIFQVFLIAVLLIMVALILFFVLKKNKKVNN